MSNDDMTRYAMSRSNIVINLIGASLETMNFSFEDVHSAWPEKLSKMAAESGKHQCHVTVMMDIVIMSLHGLQLVA
jgi:hypothetical protein